MNPAEQELIGAAIIDPRITLEQHIAGAEFDDLRLGDIWEAIRELAREKIQPTPATVGSKIATLDPQLLVDCMGLGVPADAERLADQIRETAYRRSLDGALSVAHQILTAGGDPDDALRRIAEVQKPAEQSMPAWNVMDFINRPLPPTEWIIPDLFARGDRLVLTGTEGLGKALALDTRIPTPTGWTTMGEINVGDKVIGDDGKPVNVSMVTDVMTGHRCYQVEFSDGSSVVADADHRWMTSTLRAREAAAKLRRRHPLRPRGTDQRWKMARPEVVTTEQIKNTLKARGGHCLNHSIPTTAPLDLPDANLPIDPYTLGAWLGDGTTLHAEITTHPDDVEILDEIRKAGYTVDETRGNSPYQWRITRREQRDQAKEKAAELIAAGMSARRAYSTVGIDRRKNMIGRPIVSFSEELRSAGLLGRKHIPAAYLRASRAQRLALLRGLMDTDGTISAAGLCEFSVCDRTLALGVHELLMTLGIKATFREGPARLNGRTVGTRYRITFYPNENPFVLSRKASRVIDRPTARGSIRYIKSVQEVESVPVRCIQVDNPQHMYLCGDAMIPTHNSVLLREIAVCAAAGVHPFTGDAAPIRRVLYVDLENPEPIMMRSLGQMIRAQHLTTRIPLTLSPNPGGLNILRSQDRLRLRELVAEHTPDLLVIGPAYKLWVTDGRRSDEDLTRAVLAALDDLRSEFHFALAMEHHSPHKGTNDLTRSVRPIGSSAWLRWPEFGLGLAPGDGYSPTNRIVKVVHWRGDRESRPWPEFLEQGSILPWIGTDRDGSMLRRSA